MKKIVSLLLIFIIAFSFASCGGEDFSFVYEMETAPRNLDPLLAESESEVTLSGNLFEGLMRFDDNGKLQNAGAESYEMSENGTVYTFKLKKSLKWSNKEPVTANDYVFALRRAATPSTASPHTDMISVIKGADDALAGKISPDGIGVSAIDDYTLRFTLNSPCNNFTERLAHLAFMPCNQKFFEKSKGKYGLDAETIISNGSFSLYRWDKEKGELKILKSDTYKGDFKSKASAVSFTVPSDSEEKHAVAKRISKRNINFTKIPFGEIEECLKSGNGVYNSYSITYALVFNAESEIFKNSAFAAAFKKDLNGDNISQSLPSYFKAATGIVPYDCNSDNSDGSTQQIYNYDPTGARNEFLTAQSKLDDGFPNGISILCENDEDILAVAKTAASTWQKDLGAYINIEKAKNTDELNEKISSGDFSIALIPFASSDLKAENFLSSFVSSVNLPDLNKKEFQNNLNAAYADDDGTSEQYIKAAESILLQSNYICPLFFAPVSYTYSSTLDGNSIHFHGGYPDFSSICKK